MKGAISIDHVAEVTITKNTFEFNDPGFIWNDVQVVGLINHDKKVVRASSIFIGNGLERGSIDHNRFSKN
jgi:hypothetical protein